MQRLSVDLKFGLIFCGNRLNPPQYTCKYDQHQSVHDEQCADHLPLDPGLPVVTQEGNHKKGDIDRDEYGQRTPPGIDPVKGGRLCQEDLDDREQGCVGDRHEDAVVDSQDFSFGISRQQFAEHQAGNCKHKAQFDAHTNQDQEAGAGWHCPQGMPAEVLDEGIYDFGKPVHQVQADACRNPLEVAFAVFVGVHVYHQCQQGDHDPVEIFTGAQNGEGLFG